MDSPVNTRAQTTRQVAPIAPGTTTPPLFLVPEAADHAVSATGAVSHGTPTIFLRRFFWCLALCLPVPSLMFRLASAMLCWGKDKDHVVVLDNLMTIVRELVALVSGAIYCFKQPPDLEPPPRDSLSRCLRVSCKLETFAYAVMHFLHLYTTFLARVYSEALLTMLFLCVDVGHLDHGTISKVVLIGDYIGSMVASALISGLALRYALGLAALRAELLTQPQCCLTSVLRRRRRLAKHFSVPLFLWGCNTAVGVTVALRQTMHSSSIRGLLWGLLLFSLFQVVHSMWTLVLVAWSAGALKRSLTDALREHVDGGQRVALLMADNPDALGFFSPDGRCLARLLAASLGYGVVLYQLTVPYAASARMTKLAAASPPFGPRYS